MQFDERTGTPRLLKGMENYLQSKAGEVLLAEEWNRRYEGEAVLNVVCRHWLFSLEPLMGLLDSLLLFHSLLFAFATFRHYALSAQD